MNPKDMTDQQLNNALMALLGWEKIKEYEKGWYVWKDPTGVTHGDDNFQYSIPYCTDIARSIEVQAAAIAKNKSLYVKNLMFIRWRGDYLDYYNLDDDEWVLMAAIGDLLNATPRQRAEAALMTLQQEAPNHET